MLSVEIHCYIVVRITEQQPDDVVTKEILRLTGLTLGNNKGTEQRERQSEGS